MRLDRCQQLLSGFAMLLLLRQRQQHRLLRRAAKRFSQRRKTLFPAAAINIVQQTTEGVFTAASGTRTLSGTGAGNTLVSILTQETDGVLFVAPTDSSNTHSIDSQTGVGANGVGCIASAHNIAGGNVTVTYSFVGGVSKTFRVMLLEIGSVVTTGVDTASSIQESGSPTNHVCSADASHINPSGPCIVFCSVSLANTIGTHSPGSGYTEITSSGNFTFWQYQIFSSAPTNERGAWSQTTGRNTSATIAAYKQAAGGAAPKFIPERLAFNPLTLIGA